MPADDRPATRREELVAELRERSMLTPWEDMRALLTQAADALTATSPAPEQADEERINELADALASLLELRHGYTRSDADRKLIAHQLQAVAAAARAEGAEAGAKAEREACAELCKRRHMALHPTDDELTHERGLEALELERRIRARGEKGR